MKRFLLLASLAAVAVGGVAAIPADAGAAKVVCKGKKISKKKVRVKCPRNKLRGPAGPAGPTGPQGPAGVSGTGGGVSALKFSAVGAAAETVVASGTGFEIIAACAGDTLTESDIESTQNDGSVVIASISEGDNADYDRDFNFDDGDDENIQQGDEETAGTIVYQSVGAGTVMTADFSTADEDGGDAIPGADCAIWGTYAVV